MPDQRMPKRMLYEKPDGKRSIGRPRIGSLDYLRRLGVRKNIPEPATAIKYEKKMRADIEKRRHNRCSRYRHDEKHADSSEGAC
ncbi:unnamed protein product [Nezara viridula]|uniref:Uncharacterized protein n=1 Tax=Nezara viridula TaxID=85310 RepID=A0A9P0E5C0_NEZVI|nr:unnamed protein product [Nezara viridula]